MKLSRALAQQIVNVLSATVQFPMSLVDTEATLLAGRALSEPGMLLSDQADGAEHLHQTTIPVRYAGESVGAIILHTEATHVAPVATFLQTIAEALIHQTWQFEQVVHQQWLRDRFVFQLLHRALDRSQELVEHEAAMLGIDFGLPRIVIVIDIADPGQRGTQLLTIAQRMIGRHEQDIFCWLGDHWLAMLAVIDPDHVDNQRRSLGRVTQHFIDTLNAPEHMVAAGIGRYYAGWSALPLSFEDARFALELGTQTAPRSRVFFPRDLGLASFVCQEHAAVKTERTRQLLGALLERQDLVDTLDAFLTAELSLSVTAEALQIHRHTLTYRLTKIADITGLDPRRFHQAMQLQAALIWWRYCEGHTSIALSPNSARQPKRTSP